MDETDNYAAAKQNNSLNNLIGLLIFYFWCNLLVWHKFVIYTQSRK